MRQSIFLMCLLLFADNSMALGRFFMTPEQRVQLDKKDTRVIDSVVETENGETLHFNGFVKPGHGTNTLWVNGQTGLSEARGNYVLLPDISSRNQLSVDLQGKKAHLSPGQILNIKRKVITEIYEAGQVVTKLPSKIPDEAAEKNAQAENKMMSSKKLLGTLAALKELQK